MPRKLQPAQTPGAAWKALVLATYEDLAPDESALVDQCAATLDRIGDLEEQVLADGLMVAGSTGQSVLHPACVEARLQRRELARTLDQLGLPDPSGQSSAQPDSPLSRRGRKAAESRWARRDARRAAGA